MSIKSNHNFKLNTRHAALPTFLLSRIVISGNYLPSQCGCWQIELLFILSIHYFSLDCVYVASMIPSSIPASIYNICNILLFQWRCYFWYGVYDSASSSERPRRISTRAASFRWPYTTNSFCRCSSTFLCKFVNTVIWKSAPNQTTKFNRHHFTFHLDSNTMLCFYTKVQPSAFLRLPKSSGSSVGSFACVSVEKWMCERKHWRTVRPHFGSCLLSIFSFAVYYIVIAVACQQSPTWLDRPKSRKKKTAKVSYPEFQPVGIKGPNARSVREYICPRDYRSLRYRGWSPF